MATAGVNAAAEQPATVPEASDGVAVPQSQRVLACNRCHRRKIKCNRSFPCSNCITVSSQCVQATPRRPQRRRQFPQQELLERLHHYESLLQQHNIAFGTTTRDSPDDYSPIQDTGSAEASASGDSQGMMNSAMSLTKKRTPSLSDKLNVWHTADQKSDYDDSNDTVLDNDLDEVDFSRGDFMHEGTMQKALNRLHRDNKDYLLFLAPSPNFDLFPLHPAQVHLFKLWQVYLDNVNPLLKVTHTPTLQASIIDAVSDMENIDSSLEALMLGVYCVSILSLTDNQCSTMFGSLRAELMVRYQVGCQKALVRCGYLRSDDRNCLTALYLYVISIKPDVDRRSLCSMLGSVVRIAQRMGIHDESVNTKCTAFEAEMRRRLWWSIVRFDARVCETSNNFQSTVCIPTWNCKTPCNANDSELRVEMKSLPPTSDIPTEALYVVARSAIIQYLRHSDFQLAFISPALRVLGRQIKIDLCPTNKDELTALEKMIDSKYFQNCDPESPLHCITMWITRSQLAKARLLKHYWKHSRPGLHQSDAQRDTATSYALEIVKCEAELMESPHTKGYLWHVSRFDFPAYIHILQDLKSRPTQAYADEAWRTMSDNFRTRFQEVSLAGNPVFQLLSNIIIQAWEAREIAVGQRDSPLELPWIVSNIGRFTMPIAPSKHDSDILQGYDSVVFSLDDLLPVPMDFDCQDLLDDMVPQPQMDSWDTAPLGIDR